MTSQAGLRMVRHKKRGTTYTEFARGELQSAQPVPEGTILVEYRDEHGIVWFRPVAEFEDGRFEPVDSGTGSTAARTLRETVEQAIALLDASKAQDEPDKNTITALRRLLHDGLAGSYAG